MARLQSITLRGFKTFRELAEFQPGPITVLIGPNGAGKSNFLSFFRLLSSAMVPPGQLQEHVAKMGGASAILHDGPQRTRDMAIRLTLTTDTEAPSILGVSGEEYEYSFDLAYAAGDTLIYTDEKYRSSERAGRTEAPWTIFTAGHREPELIKAAEAGAEAPSTIPSTTKGFVRRVGESIRARDSAKTILALLQSLIVHQFHDTSETSRIRQKWSIRRWSVAQGGCGKFGPFLYRLQQQYPKYYARILETIRLILPFFAEFELKPEFGKCCLPGAKRALTGCLRRAKLPTACCELWRS
jgi:predicted ATPase